MIQFLPPGRRSAFLLLLGASLLSACTTAPGSDPSAASSAAATPAPGMITAHVNGREDFFMGVGASN